VPLVRRIAAHRDTLLAAAGEQDVARARLRLCAIAARAAESGRLHYETVVGLIECLNDSS